MNQCEIFGLLGPNGSGKTTTINKEKKERITRMLELVQLLERKDSRVSTFSGGMKRRLALARALLHRPSLIYLDEPTLRVDVQSRRAIWDYILALRKESRSILITTNYLEEEQANCWLIYLKSD
jgi:ABC-2 type transport system ATP-binding protein